jgi:hypothetical protein
MTKERIINFSVMAEKVAHIDLIKRLSGRIRVALTRYSPRRSDRQLAYYWPCVVVPLAEWQRDENGEKYDEQAAHELLKHEFLLEQRVNKETGERLGARVRSTRELTVAEFFQYVEDCRNHIAKYCGILTDDADPNHAADTRRAITSRISKEASAV